MIDFMNPSDDVLVALGIGRDEAAAELAERDARIAALEGENAALKASAEANADAVSEHAAISTLMAADPVLCRYGVLEAFEMLKARADEACGEPAPPVVDRDALRDAIADALGSSAYDCARVWSAWSYGTMSQDDFSRVVDDEDRLMEIVDAVVDALASRQPCGVGLTQGQAMAEAFKDLAQRQASLGAEASAALTAQDLWDMHDTGEKETP
jgi:hypothetical protein